MKKIMLALLLAATCAVSALSFTGCGKQEKETIINKDGEKVEVVEITVCDLVMSATGQNRWMAMRQKEFEKQHPEIKVNHISTISGDTTNMVEYLTTIFMGDSAPVYYDVSSVSYIRDLYNSDLAADIKPYLTDESSFYKAYDYVQEAVQYGDAIISYPGSLEVPLLGFYNEALKEAGYNPEAFTCETWDDYYEVAKKLTKKGVSGASLYVYEYYLWPSNWFLSNGVEPAIQNEDGTITLDFTNEKFLETLNYFKKLYDAGYTNSNITYTQIADMLTLIQTEKVSSFTFYPTWMSQFQAVGIEPEAITVVPFPKGPSYKEGDASSSVILAGAVFNASKSPKELQAAVTYYEYMNGEEAKKDLQKFLAENKIESFSLSPYPSVDWTASLESSNIPTTWIESTEIALKEAYITPLRSTAFTSYLTVQLGNIIQGKVDMKNALKDAQKMAEDEWLNGFNKYLK